MNAKPRGRPPQPDKQLQVLIPEDLKQSLSDGANEAGTSLVRFVTVLLRHVQGEPDTTEKLVDAYLAQNPVEVQRERAVA